jgi:hypothetical protein
VHREVSHLGGDDRDGERHSRRDNKRYEKEEDDAEELAEQQRPTAELADEQLTEGP